MIENYSTLPAGVIVLMNKNHPRYESITSEHAMSTTVSSSGNYAVMELKYDSQNEECFVEMDGSPTHNTLNEWLSR